MNNTQPEPELDEHNLQAMLRDLPTDILQRMKEDVEEHIASHVHILLKIEAELTSRPQLAGDLL